MLAGMKSLLGTMVACSELYEGRVKGGATAKNQTAVCLEGPSSITAKGNRLTSPVAKHPESSAPLAHCLFAYCFYIWRRRDTY